jgi:hypothetical protein
MPTSQEYRKRAKHMREMADGATSDTLRKSYLRLAMGWEELADRAQTPTDRDESPEE